MPPVRRRSRSQLGLVLAAVVIVAAGFAVGIVEMSALPRGSIWGVVAVAVLLVAAIRALTTRRR